VLLRLFRLGKTRIQRGPDALGLHLLEKWKPLRYKKNYRMSPSAVSSTTARRRRRPAQWSTATSAARCWALRSSWANTSATC
jgi:hypothetical protein